VAFYAVTVLLRVRTVVRIATAFNLSGREVVGLLAMDESARLGRSFHGYEVVLVHYATSAFVGLGACAIAILVLTLRARGLRRQATLLGHVEQLGR
jgi:hypothetical protein